MEASIKDLLPGTQYAIQVRSKSANGSVSAWSTTFTFTTESDTVPPNPVTGLTWNVNETGFIGTWVKPTLDSNGLPLRDFNGYLVTVTATVLGSPVSKSYIVNQERFDFTFEQNVAAFGGPQPTVQIGVRTRDVVGNLATNVTASASNPIPADLTNLSATALIKAISLKWDASTESDFKAYNVHMSTSGPSFTPNSGNLVTSTTSPSFVLPTSNPVTHYFKVTQIDIYNQPSTNYLSASATPQLTSDLDTTPPNQPATCTVTSSAASDGSSNISVSWSAVVSTNLAGYTVRYSTDQVNWRYINVPSNQTSATIANLLPNTAYYVGVASYSFVNAFSAFRNASTYPITTAVDNVAPSQPVAPNISVSVDSSNMAQVSHTLNKQAGGALETDTKYLEVHASTVTGFTPTNSTIVGTIDIASTSVSVSGIFYYPTTTLITSLFWKVIAVDRSGNKSVPSNQATGVPGLIKNANIADATITSAKINDLEANKITAGTGVINDLLVKSSLTINGITGFIKSSNYDGALLTGWRLDQNGLVIYDGTIAAKSLQLQDSQNVAPPPFADFEFVSDFYYGASNVPNAVQLTATSGLLLALDQINFKVGRQALRVFNTAITNPTLHDLVWAPNGLTTTGLNIDVVPGEWIYSFWGKKNGTPNQRIRVGLYTDTGASIVSADINITSTTYAQYSAKLVVPSGVSKVKMYMQIGPMTGQTGYDVLIDALQLERKIGGLDTPSPWRPPSRTVIDGGAIVTGSIRSSASAVGVVNQPAWSLNTQGNLQVGDALVRGSLVVGAGGDLTNSVVQSSNYLAGTSGWIIRGDGNVELNNGTFRGQLDISTLVNTKLHTVNIANRTTNWRGSLFTSNYNLAGDLPTLWLKGTVFAPDGASNLLSKKDVQSVLRVTPEGGLQLLFDPSQTTDIFAVDGNNDYNSSNVLYDRYYGYTDFRTGIGTGRAWNIDFAGETTTQYYPDNTYYTEIYTKATAPSTLSSSMNQGGLRTNAYASANNGFFQPNHQNTLYSRNKTLIQSKNIIPQWLDTWTNTGGLAYYNANTSVNDLTLAALVSNRTPKYGIFSDIPYKTLRITTAASPVAGVTDMRMYFSPPVEQMNIAVEGGAKYLVSGWFEFPSSMIGWQVQIIARPNNNGGTTIFGQTINITASNAGTTQTLFRFGNTVDNLMTMPAASTLCAFGFRVVGWPPGVASQTFYLSMTEIVKFKDAAGNIVAPHHIQSYYPRGYSIDNYGEARVQTTAIIPTTTNLNAIDGYPGNTVTKLYAENYTEKAEVSVTPKGFKWGTIPEARKQHGGYFSQNTSQPILSGFADIVPFVNPAVGQIFNSFGKLVNVNYNEEGPVVSAVAGGYGFNCYKAGIYIMTFLVNGVTAPNSSWYLEIYNFSTGQKFASQQPGSTIADNSVTAIIPMSAGHKIVCKINNQTGGTVTVNDCQFTFGQFI